jgi:hypothetical protein
VYWNARKTKLILVGTVLLLLAGLLPIGVNSQPLSTCPVPRSRPGTFTVFWITDTQYLSDDYPSLFNQTTQWIASNYAACNGKMVIHTGDIVNDWNVSSEWSNANKAMSILLNAGIPYTWDAGNHDFCGPPSDSGAVSTCTSPTHYIGDGYHAFNATVVASKEPQDWVSSTDNGKDTAVSFVADGQMFLVVNIEYGGLAELPWVSSLLAQFKGDPVIIATHAYMDGSGSIPGWDRQYIHDFTGNLTKLMDANPNVFLSLNGHYSSNSTTGDSYHTVNATTGRLSLMFNRQGVWTKTCKRVGKYYGCTMDEVGAASVTTLTFNLTSDMVYVDTLDIAQTPYDLPSYQLPLTFIVSDACVTSFGGTRAGLFEAVVCTAVQESIATGAEWVKRSSLSSFPLLQRLPQGYLKPT